MLLCIWWTGKWYENTSLMSLSIYPGNDSWIFFFSVNKWSCNVINAHTMVNVFSLFCYRLPFGKKTSTFIWKEKPEFPSTKELLEKAANVFSAIISPWREALLIPTCSGVEIENLNSLQKDRLCLRTGDLKSSQAYIYVWWRPKLKFM